MKKTRNSLLVSAIVLTTLTSFLASAMQEFKGSTESFQKIIGQGKPVVVKFYLTNCPACKMYAAPFKMVADEFSNVIFLAVNGSNNQALQSKYGVSSYPTTIVFDTNGKKINQHERVMNAQELRQKVKRLQ